MISSNCIRAMDNGCNINSHIFKETRDLNLTSNLVRINIPETAIKMIQTLRLVGPFPDTSHGDVQQVHVMFHPTSYVANMPCFMN